MNIPEQLQFANELQCGGDFRGAVQAYRLVLSTEPGNFDALYFCGLAEAQLGHGIQAIQCLENALSISPSNTEALNAYGHVLMKAGRIDKAIEVFRKAASLKLDNSEELINLGDALSKARRPEEALCQFDTALRFKPGLFIGHYNRGVALIALDRNEEAILAFRKALELKPDFAEAANNIGMAHQAMGRETEAIDAFRQAVKAQPGYSVGWANLGSLLAESGRCDQGIECLDRAVEIDRKSSDAHYERGRALMLAGGPREAVKSFRRAFALEPGHNDAGFNLSLALLLLSEFDEAWPLYDLRLKTLKRLGGSARVAANQDLARLGTKSALAGARLLVLGEQGLGDEIMFSSVVPDIMRVAPETTMTADPRLIGLFTRSFPGLSVCAHPPDDRGEIAKVPVNRRFFVGSLMKLFRRRLDDFPGTSYLVADPARRGGMRGRLDALGQGRKIGIMWRGGVGGEREHLRSLALDDLLPILEEGGIHWISINHLPAADQETADFTARTGIAIHQWPEVLRSDDYDDTAALVAELDSVLSVTGTIAHCAAALGVPTHVLVNRVPEWRYGHEGTTVPWYEAMTLYRETDHWPIEAIGRELRIIDG